MENLYKDFKDKNSDNALNFIRKIKESGNLYGLIEGENILFLCIKYRRIDLLIEIIPNFYSLSFINSGKTDVINYCIDYNLFEYIDVIFAYLDKKENIESYLDEFKRTYYMNAVILNRISIFERLVDFKQPRYDLKENQGYTILHIASYYNYKTILSLIRNLHGKSYYLNNNENTPLHIAIERSNVEAVGELLKFHDINRSIEHKNKDGYKPIELNNGIKGLKIQNMVLTKLLSKPTSKDNKNKNKNEDQNIKNICNKVRNHEKLSDDERNKLNNIRKQKNFKGNNQELCKKFSPKNNKENYKSDNNKNNKKKHKYEGASCPMPNKNKKYNRKNC
jgi:ankyrin repeat protein